MLANIVLAPVLIGETITAVATITAIDDKRRRVTLIDISVPGDAGRARRRPPALRTTSRACRCARKPFELIPALGEARQRNRQPQKKRRVSHYSANARGRDAVNLAVSLARGRGAGAA